MKSEVVSPVNISHTAPDLPSPLISRPHLINTVRQIFHSSAELVCVEGPQGYGKTVLLREFADTVSDPCFSVFLSASSRLTYDPSFARADLTDQVYWYLNSKRPDERIHSNDGYLRILWTKSSRRLLRSRSSAYIVLDGLHDIPTEDQSLKQALMALLPFGIKPFRFLVTGDVDIDIRPYCPRLKIKSFQIPAFGSHESDEFLSEVVDNKKQRNEFHIALGGIPSLLATVRRQIMATKNSNMAYTPSFSHNFDVHYQAEWSLHGEISREAEQVLAVMLAYGYPVDAQTLSAECSLDRSSLERELRGLSFVYHSENPPGWTFVTDAYRAFAEQKLSHLMEEATESLANRLLSDPDSTISVKHLPVYLERVGKSDKLLEWFDEHRLAAMLKLSGTPASVEPTLKKALTISHDARNDLALTTYSLLSSSILQLSNTTGVDDEIRARCALGDYDGALAIAYRVPLLTQRVRLLAVMADSLSQTPGYPVQRLVAGIADLMDHIDISQLPNEEALDLAIDLYPVDPKLASKVFTQLLEGEGEDSAFELAITRISMAAISSTLRDKQASSAEVHLPLPSELLADRKLQRLLHVTRAFFHAKSGEELLATTAEMGDVSERLYIQRKWIAQNPFAKDALLVAEQALQDAIRITEFTPNATFYREIATPFAYTGDVALRMELMAVIDGQQPVVLSKGPTVDYVRLQLQLAHCNLVDNELERAASRLEDVYFEVIDPLKELETRITALAWFSAEMKHFDAGQGLASLLPIDEIVDDDLEGTLLSILKQGADQFLVLANALDALSLYKASAAIEIAKRLNTQERRDQAYFHICRSMCKSDTILPDRPTVIELLCLMSPGASRNVALQEVSERFCQDIDVQKRSVGDLDLLLEELSLSTDPTITAQCLAYMAVALAEDSEHSDLFTAISERLITEFNSIGAPMDAYRAACQLIAELKPACPTLATTLLEYLKEPSRPQSIPENVEQGIFYVFDLLVKSLSALARSRLLKTEDVKRVCEQIHEFADLRMQIRLMSTLAFYLWQVDASVEFSLVLDDYLWPVVNGLSPTDLSLMYAAWIAIYPVVWLEDRDRARTGISSFPVHVRDACTSALIFALLRGQPADEPFDDEARNTKSKLTYSDLRNLLQLADESEHDGTIALMFEWIADEITDDQAELRLSREQRTDISQRMLNVADAKFPIKDGIQHDGYKIFCKCQSLRIYGRKGIDWPDLISQGEKLENVADRAYVLARIASYLPGRQRKERSRLLKVVEDDIDNLRVQEDQFQRYCRFSDLLIKRDRAAAKRIIEKAFATLLQKSDRRNAAKENHLVELAYRCDPDLPMNLGLLYDDDPARDKYKARVEKQLAKYELKKNLGDYRSQVDLREIRNDANLANAAWRALGTLNAGRMVATDMARIRQMLIAASKFPLKTSYPMYSWALSNVIIKYSATPEASDYVRDMFEGALRSVKFVLEMADPQSEDDVKPVWQDLSDTDTQVLIEAGEREMALKFLRRWFEESAEESITIVDPYFSATDLHLLLQIVEVDPWLKVCVMTGKSHQQKHEGNLADAYAQAWREHCDHSPPETDIIIVGSITSGAAPFHDRWMLTKSAGIQLGTSINSLGNRDSVITRLGGSDLERIRRLVDKYRKRQVRDVDGNRIAYEMFELVV